MATTLLTLDTSILLRDPTRSSAAFRAIEQLIAHGELSLHLSQIVIEEVVANLVQDAEASIQQIQKGRNQLNRIVRSDVATAQRVAFDSALQALGITVSDAIEKEFRCWITASRVNLLPVESVHGAEVWKDYFTGAKPFRARRQREDIPDAFIRKAIISTARGAAALSAVIADRRLRESLADEPGITLYETLDEFIASAAIQAALGRARAAINLRSAISVLRANVDTLASKLSDQHVDRLAGETIFGRTIPGDNNEATISMVDEIENFEVDWAAATYYGEGRIAIEFSIETDVYAESALFRSDYYAMSEEELGQVSISSLNEHYVSAERDYRIRAAGVFVADFHRDFVSDEIDADSLVDALGEMSVSIDSWMDIDVIDDDD